VLVCGKIVRIYSSVMLVTNIDVLVQF
jgi:hypothetical protein